MSDTRKRRSGCLAAGGVALGLLLGVPGAASAAECTPAEPTTGKPSDIEQHTLNPPGETAVQTCSPFTLREIGRRH